MQKYIRLVLIETLWNVKIIYFLLNGDEVVVLIETLWNVKRVFKPDADWLVFCINRNIVECKVGYCIRKRKRTESINRNIVECKVFINSRHIRLYSGINRNIVECKA